MKTILETIEPPPKKLIQKSIDELCLLGALNDIECLTPLGFHLSQLPVGNVRIGKILVYGALFGATDATCALAAIMSVKSPFYSPSDKREEAKNLKMTFYQGFSDHLTILTAYRRWQESRSKWGFCDHNFLSMLTMKQIDGICNQFKSALKSNFKKSHFT